MALVEWLKALATAICRCPMGFTATAAQWGKETCNRNFYPWPLSLNRVPRPFTQRAMRLLPRTDKQDSATTGRHSCARPGAVSGMGCVRTEPRDLIGHDVQLRE